MLWDPLNEVVKAAEEQRSKGFRARPLTKGHTSSTKKFMDPVTIVLPDIDIASMADLASYRSTQQLPQVFFQHHVLLF